MRPLFRTKGIITYVPPLMNEPFQTLVPAFDADGNGTGGIPLPELSVPLGTYQGWNLRNPKYGAGTYLARIDGSFWPFPTTEKERKQTNDPRPSIEKRYHSKKVYLKKLTEAVNRLVKERFLLREDAIRYLNKAKAMQWPPRMINDSPFWESR